MPTVWGRAERAAVKSASLPPPGPRDVSHLCQNLCSSHFLLPGRRGKGARVRFRGPMRGRPRLILTPRFEPSGLFVNFRKKNQTKTSDTVPAAFEAASAALGHVSRACRLSETAELAEVVDDLLRLSVRKLPSWRRAPFSPAAADSGNYRSESNGLPFLVRLFPAAVEADKLDDDSSFGSFRRRPLLTESMTFHYTIKTRRGVIQNCSPFGDI